MRDAGGAPGDPVALVEARLRAGEAPAALLEPLARELAHVADPAGSGPALLALATAHLAAGQPAVARALLTQALPGLAGAGPALALRAELRLAAAELGAGAVREARARLGRLGVGPIAREAPALLAELAQVHRDAGAPLVAEAIDLARERGAPAADGGAYLGTLARLVGVLNSGAAGTAEPLHAALRAILDETRAARGFLLLYEGAALELALGLTAGGRLLSRDDLAYSSTIVERALATGARVLVEDVTTDPAFADADSVRDLELRSAACVPLRVERKRVGGRPAVPLPTVRGLAGVLYVDSSAPARFGAHAGALLDVCADCAVLAVRAARTAEALEAAARTAPGPVASPGAGAGPPAAAASVATRFPELVTRDPALLGVLEAVERVAPSDAAVLIHGESGTGKELVARALHRLGRRPGGPFVAVDCGAIPDDLVVHELFGRERGAFTGADEASPGLLERASGGTLFLDEAGEMSPAMQAALLRALQEGEVRRLGGAEARRVAVRVVAATHRDLRAMAERGEFRQDLLFRLAAVGLRLPPLRERPGDVPLLVSALLPRLATADRPAPALEERALARLREHGWPGNVRELENVLVRAGLLAQGPVITLGDVDRALEEGPTFAPEPLDPAPGPGQSRARATAAPGEGTLEPTLEELERRAIAERLARHGWNQVQAARSLGVDRTTLRRKIVRYGLLPEPGA